MTSGLASLDAFLDRVWEKSDAGDFSAAAELLDAAPPLDPSDIAARWQTTRAYAFAGRLAKARSLFAEPPDPSADPDGLFLLYQGILALMAEEPEFAAISLHSFLKRHPQNHLAASYHALAQWFGPEKEKAERFFHKEPLSPNHDFLCVFVYLLEKQKGHLQQKDEETPAPSPAVDTPAARPSGGRFSLFRNLKFRRDFATAEALLQDSDFAKAEQLFRELMQHHPDREEVRLAYAFSLIEQGRTRQAKHELLAALSQNPDYPLALSMLGYCYREEGEIATARALLERVPVEGPEDSNRHYILALCAISENNQAEAFRNLRIAFRDFFVDTRQTILERLL